MHVNKNLHTDHLIVTPSYICEISNVRTRPSSTIPHSGSSFPTNRHLHLFIFLKDTTQDSGLGKNCQWKQSMELHHKLRMMFQSLVVDQSKKFQQAVHSALNKLICNYGSHAKVAVCSLEYTNLWRGRGDLLSPTTSWPPLKMFPSENIYIGG